MNRLEVTRRRLLQGFAALAAGAALSRPQVTWAGSTARRVIVFYFPDGIVGQSQDGDPSKWRCTGTESSWTLSETLAPLAPWQGQLNVLHGLSMGSTDSGSHPGGAKKLLTAADHGNNESIDQYLSRTVGASSPWRHLYLGVQANANGASGDKFITYPVAGQTLSPEDDPRRAFQSLFGVAPGGSAGSGGTAPAEDPRLGSVLDLVTADLADLQGRLGSVEREKLELHAESLRELEQRLFGGTVTGGVSPTCSEPDLSVALSDADLYAPERFADVLRAQLEVMVLAMECGKTRVGTIQCSHHTSDLIMSRIPGTLFYDPGFDMRSHQASHYGSRHDPAKREYAAFYEQRRWWAEQLGVLLGLLAARPEDGGTMLDHTLVVLCSEVCDGNTHLHDDMPLVLAGGGAVLRTGRLLDFGYRRHGDLWVSVAQALGDGLGSFGDASSGPLPGLLG